MLLTGNLRNHSARAGLKGQPCHGRKAPGLGNDHNGHMHSPWLASVTPVAPPTSANPDLRFLVYAGVVTGTWSGVLCLLIYGISSLFGVPFAVATDAGSTTIPWIAALLVPLAAAVVGALLVSLLRGRSHARRMTFWVGTAIAVVSMIGPVVRAESISTAIPLALMHVVTWVLVVPQLARIIGDAEPGMSVDRGE